MRSTRARSASESGSKIGSSSSNLTALARISSCDFVAVAVAAAVAAIEALPLSLPIELAFDAERSIRIEPLR